MRTSKKYSPKNGIAPANQEARLPTKRPEPSLWSGMVNGSSCGHRASQWTVCPLAAKHVIRSVRMVGAQRARFSGNNFSASSLFLPVLRATEVGHLPLFFCHSPPPFLAPPSTVAEGAINGPGPRRRAASAGGAECLSRAASGGPVESLGRRQQGALRPPTPGVSAAVWPVVDASLPKAECCVP